MVLRWESKLANKGFECRCGPSYHCQQKIISNGAKSFVDGRVGPAERLYLRMDVKLNKNSLNHP